MGKMVDYPKEMDQSGERRGGVTCCPNRLMGSEQHGRRRRRTDKSRFGDDSAQHTTSVSHFEKLCMFAFQVTTLFGLFFGSVWFTVLFTWLPFVLGDETRQCNICGFFIFFISRTRISSFVHRRGCVLKWIKRKFIIINRRLPASRHTNTSYQRLKEAFLQFTLVTLITANRIRLMAAYSTASAEFHLKNANCGANFKNWPMKW